MAVNKFEDVFLNSLSRVRDVTNRFDRLTAPDEDFESLDVWDDVRFQAYLAFLRKIAPSGEGCWIAGGALRDLERGDPIKDVDVFFANNHALSWACSVLASYKEVKIVEHTSAVSRYDTVSLGRIDLVSSQFFKRDVDVIARMDFTACAMVVDAFGDAVRHKSFLEHVRAKKLVVNALPTPIASFWRLHRFKQRGWTIDGDELGGMLHEAVSFPESEGWLSGDVDAPPKGMPFWAELAWRAIGETRHHDVLPRVMKRAVHDNVWVTLLESVGRLNGPAEVRAFILETVDEGITW